MAARANLDLHTAREKVRTARALKDLPLTTAAMAMGRVSYSQVKALTRVATPDNEDELLELSYGQTVAAVERLVRGWRTRTPEDEVAREAAAASLETLRRGRDPMGRSELADGVGVSHETSRRVACDAGLVPLVQKLLPDGRKRILEIGRLRRPVSQPLRRALEARDRGCRSWRPRQRPDS